VYGQVIGVERLAGAARETVERAFQRLGRREIVVVPWGYDAGCDPVPWGGSARWVTTDAPGFYTLRLRPRSEWAGERPTFDAFAADLEPYPHGRFFARGYRGTAAVRTGPSLTPEEYFSLYAALPDHETLRDPVRARASAIEALDAWEQAYPEAARKYPAPQILGSVRRTLTRP
jgi:hypothetical protein